MADENVFSADPVEVDVGFNDIVGDDKKYKDPDALAKAYANIERHARTLEAENAEARRKLDLLEATNQGTNSEPPKQEQPASNDQQAPTPNSTPKADDFRSQIKEEIRALNEQERGVANIEATARKMVDLYGSQAAANEAIRKRADELGVTVDWLRDSAARSPSAFYATMGVPATGGADRSTPSPNNEVRLRDDGNQKNFEHYDRLRKENPKLYYSAGTQKEMMSQARKLGSDFYKR
jgi:hypothetical protein